MINRIAALAALAIIAFVLLPQGSARAADQATEWTAYGADKAGRRYSPLAQIDRANVGDLEVAWVYHTGVAERRGKFAQTATFENTPIMVDGQLVICTPFRRVVALDPTTGKELWAFETGAELPDDGFFRIYNCRGVSQWLDKKAPVGAPCRKRLLFGSWEPKLYAIDAANGRRCAGFGDNGEVVLKTEGEFVYNGEMGVTSAPAVINGVVVVGAHINDHMRADAPLGRTWAFDARSGRLRWHFDTIPRHGKDQAAAATWHGDSAQRTGHGNVWTTISVDEARDLVILPTSTASPDFYGGERPGDNLYTDSVVALRGATGEMVWHFQTVHHDIWDYDLPSQPLLVDLPRDGKMVPVVVQNTKQGFIFVLDRETGEPFFPIEERPVPQNPVPGEWLSPTQPFPAVPAPLVKQGLQPDDAWGFTFVDRLACRRKIASRRHDGMYAPSSFEGTVLMPPYVGGTNWGGPAFDPGRNLMVINVAHVPGAIRTVVREGAILPVMEEFDLTKPMFFAQEGTPYLSENIFLLSPLGAPCTAPPWGTLAAVDLTDGSLKWEVTLGSIEKLMPVEIPWELGTPSYGGPMITGGGLVFIAATMDQKFRAFDVDSGEKLWQVGLPAGGQATPMTYEAGGRQYVVLAAGGHILSGTKLGDSLIAYALPE